MTLLRMLWELLTGRLTARITRLEADMASFAAHYNAHVAFTSSKLRSQSEFGLATRAQLLSLASRVGKTPDPPSVELEVFGPGDDEPTLHLDVGDVEVVMPRRRR